ACREFLDLHLRTKAFVANNTINYEDFPVVDESKEEIKKEFGIPFKKVVLSVGRMGAEHGRKRVDHVIEVFTSIQRADLGLVIVGSGLSEECRRRMKTRNDLYLGEVPDAREVPNRMVFKITYS